MNQTSVLQQNTLRGFVRANAVTDARVVGQPSGFRIVVLVNGVELTVGTTRGDVRLFSLEGAAKFLADVGIAGFQVDTSQFSAGRLRAARPDRAEALRKTRTKPRQVPLV